MALGTKEKYWPGSVVTDSYGRLVVVPEGAEVGALSESEHYWPGSHATAEQGRLIVVGPGGAPITSKPLFVSELPEPSYMAHRFGMAVRPENLLESMDMALTAGVTVLNCDVWQGSDGSLLVLHDETLQRTTTGTGLVTNQTAQSWKLIKGDPASWSEEGTVPFQGWPELTPPTFEQVLALLRARGGAVLSPECKTGEAGAQKMIATIARFGLTGSILWQSFTLSTCKLAHEAGMKTIGLASTSAPAVSTLQANGVDYLGYNIAEPSVYTAPYLETVTKAGIKLYPYYVGPFRRIQWEAEKTRVGLSFAGVIVDDPAWVSGSAPVLASDPFALKTALPGSYSGGNGFRPGTYIGTNQFQLEG